MNPHPLRAANLRHAQGLILAIAGVALFTSTSVAALSSREEFAVGPLHVVDQIPIGPHEQNITWTGSVTTQGDAVLGGPVARSTFGVSGNGIKVGIISDSFNFLGGQPAGVLSGDLPGPANPNGHLAPVNILNDEFFPGNLDEGRAIAEIVHDLAPGAEVLFHSAFNNPGSSPGGSIATAIDNLVAAGANIIVDDVFSIGAPVYQDGLPARAVNNAFANGVAYFSSAGNSSNNAYQGLYSPFAINHNFDANLNEGGDLVLNIGSIPDGGSVVASLWWDDAYASLGGTPTTDFQLGLYNFTDDVVEGGSGQDQFAGADPFEAIGFTNTSGVSKTYGLFVEHADGDPNKLFRIQVFNRTIQDDDDTDSPTITGHSGAVGGLAIGAAPYYAPNSPESFTSQGPTLILYDTDGNPLDVPEIRNTPALTGIDGGNTTFFVSDSAIDADTFPNFFGTSASAPHVAAIAALVLERADQFGLTLSPAELYQILVNSAVDIGAPGYDHITGHGRLDAYLAVSAVVPEPASAMLLILALVAAHGFRRRRVG